MVAPGRRESKNAGDETSHKNLASRLGIAEGNLA